MITDSQIIDKLNSAAQFIDKNYLNDLSEYSALPLETHLKKYNLSRLFHIQKIVYDKKEDINGKLISVFHSVMPFCKSIVLLLSGQKESVNLYLGIRASQISNAAISGDVLKDSFLGNFPGSKIVNIRSGDINDIFSNKSTDIGTEEHNIAYINIIPSERKNNREEFIQGLEKFVDTMRGSDYICEILASPIAPEDIDVRMSGLEELYSALFPFSKKTSSHGHNKGSTLTEGITESISDSISQGISKAIGRTDGHNNGRNSSFNVGSHMLLSFGSSSGTQEGWSTGSSETSATSDNRTRSQVHGSQRSESITSGITDNLTVEFRDKNVEDMLEKLDRHIKRMKTGSSFGVWEVASYFISKEKKTAAIAASTYRSILLGEEIGTEKPNFNLIDNSSKNAEAVYESLVYCEHPRFIVPSFSNGPADTKDQAISPKGYVNGKELAMLFNLPRKSVSGITVAEMAEFGRNIVQTDTDKRMITIGNVYHMGQIEQKDIKIDLDSLTSHCFLTGSTGSGKSNTVYKLIEESIKIPYNIPFLVIEPAKGEYRNQFRSFGEINLFSTNPQIDQMIKLNPFAFCEGIHILEHLDRLVEIFNGCWEMYAAMPAILKEAIEEAYVSKGWDLLNSVYIGDGIPIYPTFVDVLTELPKIINSSDYSADTKGDYIGALVTRVNSMTNGIYGQIFCDDFEVDNKTLFDENTVVDLSRVGSSETKSLIMGVLILKLTEHRIANAEHGNSKLKHLTILEEAHNILKNPKNTQGSAGNNVISKSVEMIVNSIAEMRTYGEGFIIVDQSPTSVDIAAIKNTNTKIIMRLPEEEDCKIAGHSVSLSKNQTNELAKLETGVAVVMQNNWTEAMLAKICAAQNTYVAYEKPVSYDKLRLFRSTVLSELIKQFEVTDDQNVSKIIKAIEEFDIIPAKKAEMRRYIKQFSKVMSSGYDSILFGRTMLRLIGCNDAFRKAEKVLEYKQNENGELIGEYTPESLSRWYREIDKSLPQYIAVDDEYMETIRQYILHAKKFENHSISYSVLYNQIYNGIK